MCKAGSVTEIRGPDVEEGWWCYEAFHTGGVGHGVSCRKFIERRCLSVVDVMYCADDTPMLKRLYEICQKVHLHKAL